MTAALVYISSHPYSLYTKSAALPGIISGVIWNGGNALSILATRNPAVGLAIAYPSKQCFPPRSAKLPWGLLLHEGLMFPLSSSDVSLTSASLWKLCLGNLDETMMRRRAHGFLLIEYGTGIISIGLLMTNSMLHHLQSCKLASSLLASGAFSCSKS